MISVKSNGNKHLGTTTREEGRVGGGVGKWRSAVIAR